MEDDQRIAEGVNREVPKDIDEVVIDIILDTVIDALRDTAIPGLSRGVKARANESSWQCFPAAPVSRHSLMD